MLTIEIVTPEKVVHKLNGSEVILPTIDGQIGVRPGHIPLITVLKAGEIEVKQPDSPSSFYAVAGGFVEIIGNVVHILADGADRAEDLSEAKINDAIARATKMKEEATEKADFDRAASLLEASIVRMKILNRRRKNR
ncbi:F0F1 ATP synthase subunit epsilon [soil metagenome]